MLWKTLVFLVILQIHLSLQNPDKENKKHLRFHIDDDEDGEPDNIYEKYKKHFGKNYDDEDKHRSCKMAFNERYGVLKNHNKDFLSGKTTWKMGFNKFSDLPEPEFNKPFGYIPYIDDNEPEHLGANKIDSSEDQPGKASPKQSKNNKIDSTKNKNHKEIESVGISNEKKDRSETKDKMGFLRKLLDFLFGWFDKVFGWFKPSDNKKSSDDVSSRKKRDVLFNDLFNIQTSPFLNLVSVHKKDDNKLFERKLDKTYVDRDSSNTKESLPSTQIKADQPIQEESGSENSPTKPAIKTEEHKEDSSGQSATSEDSSTTTTTTTATLDVENSVRRKRSASVPKFADKTDKDRYNSKLKDNLRKNRPHDNIDIIDSGRRGNNSRGSPISEGSPTVTSASILAESEERRKRAVDVPQSRDWRKDGAATKVIDQGDCSGCWSFSVVAALETHYYLTHKKLYKFSSQQILDCAKSGTSKGCNKGSMYDAFKYLEENGTTYEKYYPFIEKDGTCYDNKIAKTKRIKIKKHLRLNDENKILEVVGNIGPVAVGIDANKLQLYESGIYQKEDCGTTAKEMNHAVLIVGYGSKNGIDYWICKNSWGTDWGERGYFRILRGKNMCGIGVLARYPVLE